jgi:hypothetical protein
MIDRRKKPRHKVRIEANLVLDDGLLRLPAQIKDESPFGAKLQLEDVTDLPERFYVLFGHRIELCRLIWQDDTQLGLAYED